MSEVRRRWKGEGEKKKEMNKFVNLSSSEIKALIDEWIVGRNAERDRQIMRRRLIDGITYERLAEEQDMSVRQIKNIVYKRENLLSSRWG